MWARHQQVGSPLTGHTDFVDSVAFSPNGTTLATGSGDKSVRVGMWPAAHRSAPPHRPHRCRPVGGVQPRRHTPGQRQRRRLGPDVACGQPSPGGLPLSGHTNWVTSVDFSPDGKRLASGSDDTSVRLWDVASHRQEVGPLTGHADEVNSVAFSPDGTTLASSSDDTSVRLWDVASHRQIGSPLTDHTDDVESVTFSPDRTTLATGSDDKLIRLWSVPQLGGNPASFLCKSVGRAFTGDQWLTLVPAGTIYRPLCP